MAAGSLDSRVSNLEELIIIIIVVILGGGRGGPIPPKGDPFASDTTRMEALSRLIRWPPPDPYASDITRMSAEAIESKLLEVNAEQTRLRSLEGELNARLKELRSKPA